MKKLSPGWYILNYHNVSWEENCFMDSLGGTLPPDEFRQHVKTLNSLGSLVSIRDGIEALSNNRLSAPLFSFWFDDGLRGVFRYAKPILDEYSVTAAISVCSSFLNRKEFFWRFKLSYLNSVDGVRFLRSRLKKHGYQFGDSIRRFTLDQFTTEILDEIDKLWLEFTTPHQREDAYRLFSDQKEIYQLHQDNWEICNHTASHYPVSMEMNLGLAATQFETCETELTKLCGKGTKYWVIPFDRKSSPNIHNTLGAGLDNRHLVFVGNQKNTANTWRTSRSLFRIKANGNSNNLVQMLSDI